MKNIFSEIPLPIIYIAQVNGLGFDPAVFMQQLKGHKAFGEVRTPSVDPCPQHGSRRGRKIRGEIEVIDNNS